VPVDVLSLKYLDASRNFSGDDHRAAETESLQRPNRGWHSRGYLPHFDSDNEIQSLNFRLLDAVPIPLIKEWRRQLGWYKNLKQNDPKAVALRRLIETYEDVGYGACFLREP
jgi:hypothetical protein